jgi:hypothetical protein
MRGRQARSDVPYKATVAGWSGLFCRLPAVFFQKIEKRLIGKVLKFLLPIARHQFEGMPCLIIEMHVLAGQLNLPRAL